MTRNWWALEIICEYGLAVTTTQRIRLLFLLRSNNIKDIDHICTYLCVGKQWRNILIKQVGACIWLELSYGRANAVPLDTRIRDLHHIGHN